MKVICESINGKTRVIFIKETKQELNGSVFRSPRKLRKRR